MCLRACLFCSENLSDDVGKKMMPPIRKHTHCRIIASFTKVEINKKDENLEVNDIFSFYLVIRFMINHTTTAALPPKQEEESQKPEKNSLHHEKNIVLNCYFIELLFHFVGGKFLFVWIDSSTLPKTNDNSQLLHHYRVGNSPSIPAISFFIFSPP